VSAKQRRGEEGIGKGESGQGRVVWWKGGGEHSLDEKWISLSCCRRPRRQEI